MMKTRTSRKSWPCGPDAHRGGGCSPCGRERTAAPDDAADVGLTIGGLLDALRETENLGHKVGKSRSVRGNDIVEKTDQNA